MLIINNDKLDKYTPSIREIDFNRVTVNYKERKGNTIYVLIKKSVHVI